jgi:hypothetical protein
MMTGARMWRRLAQLGASTACVVAVATGVGDRATASGHEGFVELRSGAAQHRFTLRRPPGVVLLFRLTLPRGTRAYLTGRLGSIAGVGMSTAAADCRPLSETLVCEQMVGWCPLPRGTWSFRLHKLSGPAGTARLEFRVGQPSGHG